MTIGKPLGNKWKNEVTNKGAANSFPIITFTYMTIIDSLKMTRVNVNFEMPSRNVCTDKKTSKSSLQNTADTRFF